MTLFKLNTNGSGFEVLLNLDYYTTGGNPLVGLIQGTDGNLYGTTFLGGDANAGTVSRIKGVWQLVATLSDGSQHGVWIQIK